MEHRDARCDDVPMPIVTLNRSILVVSILAGLLLRQPLFTTALLLVLLPAVFWGQHASLIFQVGQRLFSGRLAIAEREDRRLMRFNNTIAVVLLAGAQLAFLAGSPAIGWTLSLAVATAATVALLGFCVGCFLYYQFKLHRYRLFGS
jgi:hypothetical protein